MEQQTSPAKNGKPEGWDSWLTAGEVSSRLRCARTHVYRLEQRGELRSYDGIAHGRRVRRFDPASVAALTPTEEELEDDLAEEIESTDSKLVARVLTEARTIATDARKGQHEAYQLVAAPSRELHGVALATIKQQAERIRELEAQLNRLHDDQRDARRDDREFAAVERELLANAERKDKALAILLQAAPEIIGQLVSTLRGSRSSGPLFEWMKAKTPAQQTELISAIEVILSIEEEERARAAPPVPDPMPEPIPAPAPAAA